MKTIQEICEEYLKSIYGPEASFVAGFQLKENRYMVVLELKPFIDLFTYIFEDVDGEYEYLYSPTLKHYLENVSYFVNE